MKAAVCYEPGAPLVIEDIEVDPPQRGELKIRLAATAICHSDVHAIRGEWSSAFPLVAGHEAAGIVEEVGEQVTLAQPGDRVVVSLLRSCGNCFYCLSGMSHHCDASFALRTESRLRNQRGERIFQGLKTSAFAEHTIVDQSQVVQVPQALSLDCAALLACGVITGVGAVIHTARVRPGSTVVVIGTGGVGLNAVQGAVIAGAARILAIDLVDMKLQAARTFGATHAINAVHDDVQPLVLDLTAGRGADYVFVTVGSAAAVEQGMSLLRRDGTLVIVGMPPLAATVQLPVVNIASNGLRIVGSSMGSTCLRRDVPWLIELYQQGRLKLDELITARYPLEEINEAITSMERGEALRNLIVL